MPLVSVIIPIYNVSRFIGRCAESLMGQTLQDVEFIFVNDCTPDNSVEILQDIVSKYPDRNVRIVSHENNKGLPSARNSGLSLATGDYIFHCDGDDWMETDMLENMFYLAKEKESDIVYCDYYLSFQNSERYMTNPSFDNPEEMLRRGFLGGTMKYNVWNKLVKRKIYTDNNIRFPDGHSMGEDMTMIRLLCCSESVAYLPKALYHYIQTNSSAFSKTQSQKQLDDVLFNVNETVAFLDAKFGDNLSKEIAAFKLSIKLPFLISDKESQYSLWKEWYPEANRYVLSNKDIPLRTRLLQWMAAKNLWAGVKIYYKVVYKCIYRFLYK